MSAGGVAQSPGLLRMSNPAINPFRLSISILRFSAEAHLLVLMFANNRQGPVGTALCPISLVRIDPFRLTYDSIPFGEQFLR